MGKLSLPWKSAPTEHTKWIVVISKSLMTYKKSRAKQKYAGSIKLLWLLVTASRLFCFDFKRLRDIFGASAVHTSR